MRVRSNAIGRSIFSAICAASAVVVLGATTASTSSPGATPTPAVSATIEPLSATGAAVVSLTIWGSAAIALIVIASVFFYSRRNAQASVTTDKDLEASRIVYGFWLIIGSLILTLAVVIEAVNVLRPPSVSTADVLAVITAVTGVIGTLIAAFFGVQAAGAGRSQAMTTLANFQSAAQPARTDSKLDPAYGPHVGNTRISVTGNGFAGASAVNFGTDQGVNFESVNDGLVRVTSPPAPAEKSVADVAVVFEGVTPPNRSVGTFYYYTVVPSQAAAVHNNTVQIQGTGFTNATAVNFGTASTPATPPDANGYLNVTLPARPAGVAPGAEVDVTVLFPVDSQTNSVKVGTFTW